MKPIIDLHCHTIASGHAYSTLKENIDEAKEKGLKYLGVSESCSRDAREYTSFLFWEFRSYKRRNKWNKDVKRNRSKYNGF